MTNCRVHPTHWLISTQGLAEGYRADEDAVAADEISNAAQALAALLLDAGLELRSALPGRRTLLQARFIPVRHTAGGTRLPDLHAVLANHFRMVRGGAIR